jgi:hypothetical protein
VVLDRAGGLPAQNAISNVRARGGGLNSEKPPPLAAVGGSRIWARAPEAQIRREPAAGGLSGAAAAQAASVQ